MAGAIPFISLAVAAASAAGTAVSQSQQASSARKGRRSAEAAQRDAAARAGSEQRRSQEELRKANRQEPDMESLLSQEQLDRLRGPAATLLTVRNPGNPLQLGGSTSLLGV